MTVFGKTDTGKKRKENEDSFLINREDDRISAVVCDGMGGVQGGKVASALAANVYTETLLKDSGLLGAPLTGQRIKNAMLDAAEEANNAVFQMSEKTPALSGMGTTLVACFVRRGRAFAVNVGDSRLYRLSGGRLFQVTKDHSFVQYLLDSGRITKQEAAAHPNRNVITKALGIAPAAEADFFSVEAFDALLLCSDGLVNFVPEEQLVSILCSDKSVREKVEKLISAANKNGGGDNITAIVLAKEENDG